MSLAETYMSRPAHRPSTRTASDAADQRVLLFDSDPICCIPNSTLTPIVVAGFVRFEPGPFLSGLVDAGAGGADDGRPALGVFADVGDELLRGHGHGLGAAEREL